MLTVPGDCTSRGQVFSLDTADSVSMVMMLMVPEDCKPRGQVFRLGTADSVSMVMMQTVPQVTVSPW